MNKKVSLMFAALMLIAGSAASADTVYQQRTYVTPYGMPVTEVDKYHVHHRGYYYDDGPSVGGFVDRSAKTSIGLPGKAVKETLKAVF